MRVALITDEGPEGRGGVASWVRAVARGLVDAGHDVVLLDRRGGPPIPGVQRVAIGGPSFGRWGGVWVLRLLPMLARVDRVVAATWPLATELVRAGLDVSVVGHGSDLTRPTRDPRGRRRVFHQATRWFTVSRYLADRVPRAAVVLPAPIDAGSGPSSGADGVWGFFGRAVPQKGGDTFVRWVAQAKVRGLLVGDGPALPSWRALAEALGADVVFTGWRAPDDVQRLLAGCALVALPSRAHPDGSGAEGLGLVALEAAAVGVPAVVADVGGLPEAAGPAGLVLRPGDHAVDAIRAWWTPERGEAARAELRRRHGVARTVSVLLGA